MWSGASQAYDQSNPCTGEVSLSVRAECGDSVYSDTNSPVFPVPDVSLCRHRRDAEGSIFVVDTSSSRTWSRLTERTDDTVDIARYMARDLHSSLGLGGSVLLNLVATVSYRPTNVQLKSLIVHFFLNANKGLTYDRWET